MGITKGMRYRVNINRTTTNKVGWDCTVEGEGYSQEHILHESDQLVKALERRYPPTGKEESK